MTPARAIALSLKAHNHVADIILQRKVEVGNGSIGLPGISRKVYGHTRNKYGGDR
jgi:hypothetical protein